MIILKVKELKKKLEEFDDELEVMTDNIHRQDLTVANNCRIQYETLDKAYVYIG